MGLYICRRAAESLGARVWLEHSGPGGSTFCVWLPFGPPEDADQREGDRAPRLVGLIA